MLILPQEKLRAHMLTLAHTKSEKKAAASRKNGALGGRPPKKHKETVPTAILAGSTAFPRHD